MACKYSYFIIHQKVIGGRLFSFWKIGIWVALPGSIQRQKKVPIV